MIIREQEPLSHRTTLKVGGHAAYFCEVHRKEELQDVRVYAQEKNLPVLFLGGGSNVLISNKGFSGLVVSLNTKGITYKDISDSEVSVEIAAGELWDDAVRQTVEKGLWGLENLSYIPGKVGACPVQNIGAYGVEVKDTISSVTVFNMRTGAYELYSNADCAFGYRDSVFKKSTHKHLCIVSVTFTLSRIPKRKIDYKDVSLALSQKNITEPSIEDIRSTIIEIRKAKFPDMTKVGTAGSFWKNPIISESDFNKLKHAYPLMPSFPARAGFVKIPLAWILDNVCHLKGFKEGNVGLFEKQPLVLVAYDRSSDREVRDFAQKIALIVKDKTGVSIEPEVEYIG